MKSYIKEALESKLLTEVGFRAATDTSPCGSIHALDRWNTITFKSGIKLNELGGTRVITLNDNYIDEYQLLQDLSQAIALKEQSRLLELREKIMG